MLELKGLSYQVEDNGAQTDILRGIDLTIDNNKFVVITGPNGGGKSTLARLIMGIEKPTSGRIDFEGQDITAATIDERARMGIGYGFQAPARFKGMKVRKLLKLASGKKISAQECNEYLSAVGLCSSNYLMRDVDKSLSGGELKRIEIATVLARGTRLAVFDEPEAGIDLWSFQSLIQVFENMRKRTHGSILIISHQERILEIADEIVLIADGRVEKQGRRDDILPELMKTTAPAMCNRIMEGGRSDAQ